MVSRRLFLTLRIWLHNHPLSILFCIISLGALLRFHDYSVYPQRGATSDEYAFAFAGLSIIQTGVPTSWSAIAVYPDRHYIEIDSITFPLVTPYVDHPPLFSLLVGGWSWVWGARDFSHVSLDTIRIVPIVLSMISLYLVYALGSQFSNKIGLIAALIYAIVPVFAINQRVVFAEHLVTVLLLLSLLLLSRPTLTTRTCIGIGLLCGLALMTKILGICVIVSVLLYARYKRKPFKALWWIVGSFMTMGIGFLLYHWYVDLPLFISVQQYQGARSLSIDTVWRLITNPSIVHTSYRDGWYLWGWISICILLTLRKSLALYTIPVLVYTLLVAASVNVSDIHGWYAIVLYPFLAIASSIVLVRSYAKKSLLLSFFYILVGGTLMTSIYESYFGMTSMQFRICMLILSVPLIGQIIFPYVRWHRYVHLIFIFMIVLVTILTTYTYTHPA